MQKRLEFGFEDHWQLQRFLALKNDSRERIGTDELTHGAFLTMLLDVWEHHLESRPGELETEITIAEHPGAVETGIVRDSEVETNAQTS